MPLFNKGHLEWLTLCPLIQRFCWARKCVSVVYCPALRLQCDTVWEKPPGNLHHLLDGPEAPLSKQSARVLWPFPALEANLQVMDSQKARSKTLFSLGPRKHIGNAILLQIEPATSHEPAWEKLESWIIPQIGSNVGTPAFCKPGRH